jgi:DNA-directed RNA polymerase subunit RPC12/RpoP
MREKMRDANVRFWETLNMTYVMVFLLDTPKRFGKMEKNKPFVVDLSKTKRSGEFKCPKCGIRISPDDRSENAYTILETIMRRDCLEKLILQCNKCGSKIQLVGFNSSED